MVCRKIHINDGPYDVYIGRPSKWGNPFSSKQSRVAKFTTSNRKESIDKHREWFLKNKSLLNDLHELQGKTLACWCKEGKQCHGDIIVAMVNSLDSKLF